MHRTRRSVLSTLAIAAADLTLNRSAIGAAPNADWTTPQRPYRIASNLYYVGSRDLASFLLHTSDGHILINSNLATSPAQIKANVEQLGFRFSDIKILLISHAHYDHCAGSAEIKHLTGAKYMVMDADVQDVESGGRSNFQFSSDKSMFFPATKIDRILKDGEQVRLGSTVLTARKTPGHTKGCTTWTCQLADNGHSRDAVIVGSPYVLSSYNLIDDPKYPQMAADFTETFRVLKSLPCELFLGAHGGYYDMLHKYAKLKAGNIKNSANPSATNPFIDPTGYRKFIADAQETFERNLADQRKARQPSKT